MKQIPELELPEFEITPEQLQGLVCNFWDKLEAIDIRYEEDWAQFSKRKDALIEPLRELVDELMVQGPHTKAKFVLRNGWRV